MSSKKGFTLVELLVVIILVAVLVAVALPRYMDAVYRGKVAACKQNISDLNTAIQAYQAKNGSFPTAATFQDDLVSDNFLDAAVVCPFGVDYTVTTDTDTNGHTIAMYVDTSTHFTGDWKTATEHL